MSGERMQGNGGTLVHTSLVTSSKRNQHAILRSESEDYHQSRQEADKKKCGEKTPMIAKESPGWQSCGIIPLILDGKQCRV